MASAQALIRNNENYVRSFKEDNQPPSGAKHAAALAGMGARLDADEIAAGA